MYLYRVLAILSAVLLISCGGGGGGSGGDSGGGGSGSKTSISVNPTSLEFTTIMGSSSTPTPVNVSFKGDGMLVGYPAGSTDPGWLTVSVSESYTSPVTVNVQVHAFGKPAGTYRTTLRFVTGKEDGSNVVYKDVPVTMIVEEGASISNESLSFTSLEAVPAENKSFNITTKSASEWSLSVQYSSTETNWLTLSQSSGNLSANGSTSVTVSTKGIKQGAHTASIVLKDKSGSTIDSLNVNYQVNAGVSIDPGTAKTITESASIEDLQWSVPLQSLYKATEGSGINWTLSSDKAWVKVISNSGSLNENQDLQFELDSDELLLLGNGNHLATLTMQFNNESMTTREFVLTLDLNVNLQFTITPTSELPNFGITKSSTEADLEKSYTVGINAGPAFYRNFSWAVNTGHPLIHATTASGDLVQNSITLKINKEDLLENNELITYVSATVGSSHPRVNAGNFQYGVAISIPKIDSVSPYVGFTNQSGPIVVSGSGFGLLTNISFDIGGQQVEGTVISSNAIRLNYPELTDPQSIKLQIPNALGLDASKANLIIKHAPNYVPAKIAVNNKLYRFTLDAERQSVLLTGREANELTKLTFDGEWNASSLLLDNVQFPAIALDGKEILVSVCKPGFSIPTSILHVNPDNLSILQTNVINDDLIFTDQFDLIANMFNGNTLLMSSDQWSNGMYYPSLAEFDPPHSHGTQMILSRDKSLLLTGGINSSNETYSFDGNTYTARFLDIQFFRTHNVDMSTNASRIVAGSSVYNANFDFIGNLDPILYDKLLSVSPDGQFVYVIVKNENLEWMIHRYNISENGPYIADRIFSANLDQDHHPLAMIISDDGNAAFIISSNLNSSEEPAIFNVLPLNQ
jgi:IPT/TIG domain/Viral BACON domain